MPIYPGNWDGQISPVRGLKEEEERFLDILLCKSH